MGWSGVSSFGFLAVRSFSVAVKSLVPGQDLTRVTIPPFYLEPRSLLERMSDLLMHPDLLLGVSRIADPLERMRAITRWFLSGWHYKTVGVQKPLNPIVGETFACFWPHADGSRSQYFAEQVCGDVTVVNNVAMHTLLPVLSPGAPPPADLRHLL